MLRTNICGELNETFVGKKVSLCGWVDTRRDHGNVIFIDLRDRWGKIQLVFNPNNKEMHALAEKVRPEYVLRVTGTVEMRPQGTTNLKLATGMVEIHVKQLEILNTSETPPFEISDTPQVSEDLRLKYRYLDLRSQAMRERLIGRHRVVKIVRDYLDELEFVEVETPMLTKSTPEGARDFLVPSRLSTGCFYALPQSPQLFKQILMVSGFDRYVQIARCFRDEDLRADRQLEHTQIDLEMSFITEEDIQTVVEGLVARVFKAVQNIELRTPFERLPYDEAMNRYGSDKPDLRFGLEIHDVTELFKNSGKNFARSDFDELTVMTQELGAKGLIWLKVLDNSFEGPVAKFITPDQQQKLKTEFGAQPGDTIFIVADKWQTACVVLGGLRNHFGDRFKMKDKDAFRLLWVVDFPSFEWNEEEKRCDALHHPFTSPREADLDLLEKDPLKVKARAYDLVLNGTEIGGGSIRIHREDIQKKYSVL